MDTFPKNKIEALALLYLENQDLTNLTPTEIAEKFDEAENKITQHYSSESSPNDLIEGLTEEDIKNLIGL